MGTIAEKLNYLNDTKGLFKNRINSLGGEITEQTTFRNYITWLDKFYNEVSDETDMAKNGIVGDTEQDSTTGKNLLNTLYQHSAGESVINNGVTFTFNQDGSIKLSGTATASAYVMLYGTLNSYSTTIFKLPTTFQVSGGVTYPISISGRITETGNYQELRTATGDTEYGNIFIQVANGQNVNTTIYPQIEEGNTATSYEPYTGGQPSPNPEFSQEIKNVSGENEIIVTGKNKYDNSIAGISIAGTMISNLSTGKKATLSSETYNTYRYGGVPLPENYLLGASIKICATIQPSASNIGRIAICQLSSSNQVVGNPIGTLSTSGVSGVINLPNSYSDGATHFGLLFYSNLNGVANVGDYVDYTNVMLILSTETNTKYEPYISRTFTINLKSKNLFDKNGVFTDGYLYQTGNIETSDNFKITDYISIKPNTYYTTSGMNNGTGNAPSRCYYDKNKKFISGLAHNSQNPITDISPVNAYYMRESVRIIDFDTIQIEEGSQPTSYSQYFEPIQLCKQDTYQDFIKRSTGKNLFDKNNANIFNGYISSASPYSLNASQNSKTLYIGCKPNTTYTIQKIISNYFRLSYTNEPPKNNLNTYGYIADETSTNLSITTGNDAKYLVCTYWVYNDTLTEQQILDSIQIEEGNSVSSYEPYGHQFYLHKDIGDVLLDGTEDWDILQSAFGYRFRTSLANSIESGVGNVNSYCSHFSLGATYSNKNVYAIGNTGNLNISLDETYTTVEQFKQWLSTHNIKVQYVLQTPTIEVISEENYPVLFKQLSDIQDYLTSYKINKEFILGYDEPNVEY